MLNQVQHLTGNRNLSSKSQMSIKNSNKIRGTFKNARRIWTAMIKGILKEERQA